MKPAPFQYLTADTVEEVSVLLARHPDEAKVLAGGQSLGPLLNLRMSTPSILIDLGSVESLHREPDLADGALRLSAMSTYREIAEHPLVRRYVPLFVETIPYIGHRAIRNVGTIGGSVAHADPAAELPAALLALGGSVLASSASRTRSIGADRFFTGVFTNCLDDDEIVTGLEVPAALPFQGDVWMEVAPRHGDYAVVGIAVSLRLDGDRVTALRTVLSGVSDTPYVMSCTDDLVGAVPTADQIADVARAAAAEVGPRPDLVASVDYKRHLVHHLVTAALDQAVDRARVKAGDGVRDI